MGYYLVLVFIMLLVAWSFVTFMKSFGKPAKQRSSQNSLEVVQCPQCSTYLPDIISAKTLIEWLFQQRTCPHCKCIMDKEGNFIK
ncbi:MAG: hypothetical protein JW904_08945 [Spirochaetales bacterium]|nr:hypothetical protein [Spirochaetales bacterium]